MSTILVIEDNLESRELLCFLLQSHGFLVISADDGIAGLRLVKEKLPDLIISDLHMPCMSGFEVLRRLKQNPILTDIPFVFCTSSNNQDYHALAEELGADAFITKPYDPSIMIKAVHTSIAKGDNQKVRKTTFEVFRQSSGSCV
ncbi:MAG: response regulator [Leptolyngbyaceae cyanobacterium HOT.MB2.61]|nr:response regulator [Leptolyngbyaceae cyanobacterium HOT.MB2.61]